MISNAFGQRCNTTVSVLACVPCKGLTVKVRARAAGRTLAGLRIVSIAAAQAAALFNPQWQPDGSARAACSRPVEVVHAPRVVARPRRDG